MPIKEYQFRIEENTNLKVTIQFGVIRCKIIRCEIICIKEY